MRKSLCVVVAAIAAIVISPLTAHATSTLKKQISGRSYCYGNGTKITFNADGTMTNNFGKIRRWSVDNAGTSITYSGPGFSHTVPTTIDASGALTEKDLSGGPTSVANPC
jgi:hypothetical protein